MRHLLFLALVWICTGCAQPVDPDGAVGRSHRLYVDAQRPHWSGEGPRPLATTIWYPAAQGSAATPWRAGVFEFGLTAPDAPVAEGARRPLVILTHGTGGAAAQLSWLAEALVEAGFIAAAVNHHGNTAAEEESWPHGFVLPWERARDISALVDQLLVDDVFAAHIDPERIGVAGFSLGGYSALASVGAHLPYAQWQAQCARQPDQPSCRLPPEATFTLADVEALARKDMLFRDSLARNDQPTHDHRIRAAFLVAPALLPMLDAPSLTGVSVPVHVVLAQHDDQVALQSSVELLARHLPGASRQVIDGAGHYVFLAPCNRRGKQFVPALCKDAQGIDRAAVHGRVGTEAAAFFNAHLGG